MCRIRKKGKEMKPKNYRYPIKAACSFFILVIIFWHAPQACSYPVTFEDSQGHEIIITERPSRVVSLVPSITEIIFSIGAGDAVKGVTYHDTYPPDTNHKEIVGGFFSPSLAAIERAQPDVIFFHTFHERVRERFGNKQCALINLETNSIADSYKTIRLLGRIFNRENQAAGIIRDIKQQLELIAEKVEKIPDSKRKRVVRLMGHDPVTVPGDDSFQNEMIRAAGGIPPELNKKGHIVAITKDEWVKFNPQVIYSCGNHGEKAGKFFSQPGWKDVEAVKNGRIFSFPCDLTCRVSTNTGYFVSWLSAKIYTEEFLKKENQVLEERVFKSRPLEIPLNYIKHARIAYSHIYDFVNKTLIIDFTEPLSVVSTLEGSRKGILSVGNHYSPPPCWAIGHKLGLRKTRERVYQVVGKSEDTSRFLFTGADMDNVAIKSRRFKAMEVFALVTAGVKSNAVRMSKDEGKFYEPGTINIILLPNMELTPRAMARAIISATEAKTAVLMDMDIRSSETPRMHQATGTGTDNIVVVEGTGREIDNAGGHTKMGELIARAVYDAVQEAVYNQNGLLKKRNVFQRLQERHISVFGLFSEANFDHPEECNALRGSLEEILLQPRYSNFITSSFALSDDYERGLVDNLSTYDRWCKDMAEEIAGREIEHMKNLIDDEGLPLVIYKALNGLMNGIYYQAK
jgi:ABC-type Fe3+-hydroxamate transport system substrate-binding protein/adenosylcobinamide amidohydrolase